MVVYSVPYSVPQGELLRMSHPPATTFTLMPLDAGTNYNVRVSAVSAIGTGVWSAEQTEETYRCEFLCIVCVMLNMHLHLWLIYSTVIIFPLPYSHGHTTELSLVSADMIVINILYITSIRTLQEHPRSVQMDLEVCCSLHF